MKKRWILMLGICLLLFSVLAAGMAEEAGELVPNGSFEEFSDSDDPVGWFTTQYRVQEGYSLLKITQEKARTGISSAMVENASSNDARFINTIHVEPSSLYRLSGYVLVESMEEGGNGANLAIEDVYAFSEPVFDTQGQWKYVECFGETGPEQTRLTIGARVGGYGAESVGKAYFDDISLVKLDALPGEAAASLWYKTQIASRSETTRFASAPQKSTLLFVALALMFVLMAALFQKNFQGNEKGDLDGRTAESNAWTLLFILLMMVAFGLRLCLGAVVEGYEVDINCFKAWALRMASKGPAHFYAPDYFCDYPPGYMLMLWPVGLVLSAMKSVSSPEALLMVKAFPILSDMAVAMILFLFARKRFSVKGAAAVALLFAMNPAALVNGAAWGQVDSLLALLMILAIYFAMKGNWTAALPLYVLGALIKPQALLLGPVGLLWLIAAFPRKGRRLKWLWHFLGGLLASGAVATAVVLPFAINQEGGLAWLISLYGDTLSSYGYATINAANLYYLLGANWRSLETQIPEAVSLITGLLLLGFGMWKIKVYERQSRSLAGEKLEEKKGWRTTPAFLSILCITAGITFAMHAVTGCTYQTYGMSWMVFVYLWVFLCAFSEKNARALPFYAALALIGVYVLGLKIHERYLLMALPLLLMAYVTTRDRRLLGLFAGFSATTFVNTAIVLDNSILFGSASGHLNDDTLGVNIILCLVNLALCLYAGAISFAGLRESIQAARGERVFQWRALKLNRDKACQQALLSPPDARLKMGRKDWLIVGITTVLYAGLAFTNLGSTKAPQNGWVSSSSKEQIVFELEQDTPYYLLYYAGVSHDSFSVSVSDDGVNWRETIPCQMKVGLCYQWKYAIHQRDGGSGEFLDDSPENRVVFQGRYLRLNAEASGLNLMEILARDMQGNQIPMKVVSHTGVREDMLKAPKPPANLLDEQDTLQGEPGWFNSMYFDEIYHGRTAYEHLHGTTPYETTHPPLGKLMMAAGAAVFGMTPFGWRFAGALIGVLMLPALYLLAKQLFKRRDLAAFAMLLMTFDLMHFTQTRIATIDSFPVFFIILSYLFMARYMMMDIFAVAPGKPVRLWSRAFVRSLALLALCGLMMGLSIASKWIGLYSAVGLAVLFFLALYKQFLASQAAFDIPIGMEGPAPGPVNERRIENAREHTLSRMLITCGLCLVFFIAVPAVIYYLSYIPYLAPDGPVTLDRLIRAQESMLDYHSTPGLGMDHPFQSPWWQWPFILKPMWFFQGRYEPAGFASTILCMGNPLIFYVGAFCMAAVLAAYLCKRFLWQDSLCQRLDGGDGKLTVLTIGFLAQYLPWVLVPRSMYIYHYFASVPFIILSTAWAFSLLPEKRRGLARGLMWGYVGVAAAFFVLFFPYASGILTSTEWLDALKWFPGLYY